MTVAAEESRFRSLLDGIELVESVLATMDKADSRRSTLHKVTRLLLSQLEPVRVEIAARLLELSDKTIRAWAKEGLLTQTTEEPRVLLDPVRLHEVIHLVNDLREAGHRHNLLDAVWHRLSDQALLDRSDLQESIGQMKQGKGKRLI